MDQKYSCILIFILGFADCHISYIVPSDSTNRTILCPPTSYTGNCIIMLFSQVGENLTVLSESNDVTLLFLPGNHTLKASVTIKSLSSFTMMSNRGLPRPVIKCEKSTNFHFLSISYVKIDGISIIGCLNNRISMIDEFIISNSTMQPDADINLLGRAMIVKRSTFLAVESLFGSFYSAIYLSLSSATITNCTFRNNHADGFRNAYGGALFIDNGHNITIEYSTFSFHNGVFHHIVRSGSVMYSRYSEILITNCSFNNNHDGAIVVSHSIMKVTKSYFAKNASPIGGAAIEVQDGGMITISDTHFFHNIMHFDRFPIQVYSLDTSAKHRAAIYCHLCKMEIKHSKFERNKGIAVHSYQGQIKIDSCQFISNQAEEVGGGFYANKQTKIHISGTTTFKYNSAHYGAAFYAYLSTIYVTGRLSIIKNTAWVGAIGLIHSTATIKANIVFSGNIGSFFVYSGEVLLGAIQDDYDEANFIRNYQHKRTGRESEAIAPTILNEGGAITLFVSRLELQINTTLSHNTASNGGGILAVMSIIVCNHTLLVSANTVRDTGGGLYLYQSELSLFGFANISNNTAEVCGGGIHAINALLKLIGIHSGLNRQAGFTGSISFELNTAVNCGGGAFFETGSKIIILELQYSSDIATVRFIKNTADYGGAMYIADDTNVGMCSSGQKHTLTAATQSACFFHLSAIFHIKSTATITDAFSFYQNQANTSGADLFGGLLDRCTVSSYRILRYSTVQGYVRSIEQNSSSKPVRVCLCIATKQVECGFQPTTITIKKDEKFAMHIAAVDQMNHTVKAMIHSYLSSNLGSLGEGQQVQSIGSSCENITFSIVSPKQNEEVVVYAEGPCKDLGISPLRIPINFIPCQCPLGFEQYKVIKNKCVCVCHYKLKEVFKFISESDCNTTTLLIRRNRDFWVSYTTNDTLLTVKQCPL